MTDNDIIKALECHSKRMCSECPLREEFGGCSQKAFTLAFELINRQKAELERLQIANRCFADIGKLYSEIRVEAIKEFAEKLKEKKKIHFDYHANKGFKYVEIKDIDNLVKEMVGAESG